MNDYIRNELDVNVGDSLIIIKLFRKGSSLAKKENLFGKFSYLIIKGIYHVFAKYFNGFDVPLGTKIGGGLRIAHSIGVTINEKSVIGKNCTIFQNVTIGAIEKDGKALVPVIGDNVYIGCNATILGSIYIGNNVKIGANALITKDVLDNSTAVGFNKILTPKTYISETDS